ncbi:MAG TPA: hypothetical protein VMT93_04465 [Gemmatimonadaceae bacterium]|nr:hypothetical protein [Gemmatimonadaceae bacterium]
MTVPRSWGAALAAAISFAAPAALAQGKPAAPAAPAKPPAPACTITYDKPDEIKDAHSSLGKAEVYFQQHLAEQEKKPLSQAVEKLTLRNDRYAANMNAHDQLLAQALVMWSVIPGVGENPKRGTLGFLGDKEQPIDLLKTADSLFSIVEKNVPACAEDISTYRQMAWGPIINQVGPLLNAGKLDSAAALVTKANGIYRDSPFNYYFEGQIAYRQDRDQQASIAYEKATQLGNKELAANPNDANIVNITEWSAFFAAYAGQRAAAKLPADSQPAAYKRVIGLYQSYLKTYGCPQFAENAQSSLFDVMRIVNDTAGERAELKKMSEAAKPCTDIQWYTAARDARDLGDAQLAITLADKAVAFSPWSAGLGNAAAVYFDLKAWDKLLPAATRLTQIAPNLPDNYQLVAQSYLGFAEKEKSAAKKKALTDSATTFYDAGEKLDVNIRISEFTSDGNKRVVGGSLKLVDHTPGAQSKPAKGKGGKPAAAAPAATAPKPRTVTVKVSFLDRSGAVVTTDSATVNASTENTKFKITVTGDKIIGYKYAPVQ